jgi:hypothetical protein
MGSAHWLIPPNTWPQLLRASENAAVEATASTECPRIRFAVLRAGLQLAYLSGLDIGYGLMATHVPFNGFDCSTHILFPVHSLGW